MKASVLFVVHALKCSGRNCRQNIHREKNSCYNFFPFIHILCHARCLFYCCFISKMSLHNNNNNNNNSFPFSLFLMLWAVSWNTHKKKIQEYFFDIFLYSDKFWHAITHVKALFCRTVSLQLPRIFVTPLKCGSQRKRDKVCFVSKKKN